MMPPLDTPLPLPSHYLLLFRERMKLPFMNEQCEQMLKISNEFLRLQVSYDEYLCMKVLLLLSTGNYIITQQDFSDPVNAVVGLKHPNGFSVESYILH